MKSSLDCTLAKSSSESIEGDANVVGVAGSSARAAAALPPLSVFLAGGCDVATNESLLAAGALRFRSTGDVVVVIGSRRVSSGDDETGHGWP